MARPCGCNDPKPAPAAAQSAPAPRQLDHLNLLAFVHKYPPTHNAGAEWMLHHTLRFLNGRGHESRVLVRDRVIMDGEVFDGVHLTSKPGQVAFRTWARWATHVVTHLDMSQQAMLLARQHNLPDVHLVHNDFQLAYHRVRPNPRRLAVFNSEWIRDKSAWDGEGMVLYPPVPPERYRLKPEGDRIVLFNLSAQKGAELFYSLAALMPEHQFLGVTGAYGKQVPAPELPNLEVVGHDPDVRKHLARARLIVMPSSYESFGRVAVEAAVSGIPSVVSATPGLAESLGDAALQLPVTAEPAGTVGGRVSEAVRPAAGDVAAWSEGITSVLDDWETWSHKALRRAVELHTITTGQLVELDQRLRALN